MVRKQPELLNLWDRLQLEEAIPTPKAESKGEGRKFDYKKIDKVGNIFGFFFWTYVIVHVFFFDVDNYLYQILPQGMENLIRFKFIFFIVIVTLFAILFKHYYFLYFYIIFYPLIVIFWKILLRIYKFKSWILFLAVIELIASIFQKFKLKIIMLCLSLINMLIILTSNVKTLLIISVLSLSAIITIRIVNTIYTSFKSSRFIKSQSKLISSFWKSDVMSKSLFLDEKIKKTNTKKLTTEQSNAVLTNIQNALIIHRLIYFWAYQLDKYRSSKVSFLLSGISYVWLYLVFFLYLCFINFGLYQIDSSQFIVRNSSFISFANYSLNSMYFSETSQIVARSDVALLIRVVTGFISTIVLAILILNFLYVIKNIKDDNELSEAISNIKKEGKELGLHIEGNYRVSIKEAIEKLRVIRKGLLSFVLTMTSQLPDDYDK